MKNTLLIIYLVYNISTLKCDTLQQYSTPHTKEYCTADSCVYIVQDDNPATKYAQGELVINYTKCLYFLFNNFCNFNSSSRVQ